MKRTIVAALLCLYLAGCASAGRIASGNFTTPVYYSRADMTREAFDADVDAAERAALLDSWITSPQMRSSFVSNRLRAQGYRIVQPEDGPPDWARYPRD